MRNEIETNTTPSRLGVTTQGVGFVMSDFADRFFWARHKARIGAPTIASKIGCSQALISNIENHGSTGSKYNDKFAKLFGVDAEWLATGKGKVPQGFDPKVAEEMRKNGPRRGADVVRLEDYAPTPRWAGATEEGDKEAQAARLQKRLMDDFQDYARVAGAARAQALVELFPRLLALIQPAAEKPKGNDH